MFVSGDDHQTPSHSFEIDSKMTTIQAENRSNNTESLTSELNRRNDKENEANFAPLREDR